MKAFVKTMMILVVVGVLVAAEAAVPLNAPPSSPPPGPPGGACDVKLLMPCLNAFTSKASPSPECCKKLKAQEPCFCKYMKDPNLQKYLNSPNAKNVAKVCMLTLPKC